MSVQVVEVPGDKSLSHRWLILASLASGESRIEGVSESRDVASTARCLRALGARVELDGQGGARVLGPTEWRSPAGPLDCGNSGTTARLLAGLVAGVGVRAELTGDDSLSSRPMDRVVYPLQAMGARVVYLGSRDRLPILVKERTSGGLRALRYRPRISSAQVRGALLLAALSAGTDLEIVDRGRPRDHTERLLAFLGGPIRIEGAGAGDRIRLNAAHWDGTLKPLDGRLPGDVSSSAFLIAAALLLGRPLQVDGVGLNPRRTGFLDVLSSMGARVEVVVDRREAGEPVGTIRVWPGPLRGFDIDAHDVPGLLDEIPALVAVASRVPHTSRLRGAGELRVKETDRLALLAANLRELGVECAETADGLTVTGSSRAPCGSVVTGGDHRIAMAFGVLGRLPGSRIVLDDRTCVDVSYPDYWRHLDDLDPGSRP